MKCIYIDLFKLKEIIINFPAFIVGYKMPFLDIASISHLKLRILTWNALEADIPLKQVLLLVDMEGLLLLLVVEGDMQEGHILSLQGEDFELILYMEPQ